MELRHLRYLVGIADAGTFSRAADELRVAQPALTRQMHDLERELGAELFDPQARRATLTPAGEVCARLAREIVEAIEQAVARARLNNSGIVGRCVILTGPLPLASGLLPTFVARMQVRFPGITIVLDEAGGEAQWDAIINAEADIGIGAVPPQPPAQLAIETQRVYMFDAIFVSPEHPLAARTSVTLDDLRDVPFLALEDFTPDLGSLREALEREMVARGFPQSSIYPRRFSSIESLILHVRAGQGWSITPTALAARLPGIAVVPLEGFRAPFRAVRIWRTADTRPITQTVLAELRRFTAETIQQDAEARPTPRPADQVEEPVPTRLELRHLRSFMAVTLYGSLGRAAESLEVTQPALSRQMRELEYDVGVTLLERTTRGVEATPVGEEFLGDVKRVIEMVDRLPREVRRGERETTQRCIVGVVPHPWVDHLMAQVITDLESRATRVRIGLRSVITPRQPEELRSGGIDIGVGHAFPVPTRHGEMHGISSRKIFDDRICMALVAVDHRLASSPSLALRELAAIPFLWVSRDFFPRFHDAILAQFAAGGLRPRVNATYDGLTTIWSLVAQGMGWTIGWRSHATEPPHGLRAIPLRDFDMEWGGELMYRVDESRPHVLAAVAALMTHSAALFTAAGVPGRTLSRSDTPGAAIP